MKKVILYFSVFVAMNSCDTTEEYYLETNSAPEITFTFLDNSIDVYQDSTKVSGVDFAGYQQNVTVFDINNNIKDVTFRVSSGQGLVINNGFVQRNDLLSSERNQDIYEFIYYPDEVGFHEVKIFATDYLNGVDTVVIRLTAFDNLAPKSVLKVRPSRVLGDYEYILDASESFDGDAKYGGDIIRYKFFVNNTPIETDESSIRYIFGGRDIVILGLQVLDNNYVWGERFEDIFLIE